MPTVRSAPGRRRIATPLPTTTAVSASTAGTVVHDGDPVFAAHMAAVTAAPTVYGWKITLLQTSRPIDAATACAMARERCAQAPAPAEIFATDG